MKHIILGLTGMLLSVLFYKPGLAQEPLPEVVEMLESVDAIQIENTIKTFSAFRTRYHNDPEALKAQAWLKSKWEEMAQGREDVWVDNFPHPGISPMPSVIATIEGSLFPEEIIVFGAHADCAIKEGVGMPATDELNMGKRCPGADDNASGVAVITEVFRVLMEHEYSPERTFMAMAWSAEEIGLKGSEHIATSFAEDNRNVIGVLNFDLTNYKGSPDLDLVLVGDFTSPAQNAFLERLIRTYLPEIMWEYIYCRRGCSDHASWRNAGFHASMLAEARLQDITPHIHKVTDTFEASGGNARHSVNFVKLSLAFGVEIGRFGLCRYNRTKCL